MTIGPPIPDLFPVHMSERLRPGWTGPCHYQNRVMFRNEGRGTGLSDSFFTCNCISRIPLTSISTLDLAFFVFS